MMELADKLNILVNRFCEQNADVIESSEIVKILLRSLVYEAGMIVFDHETEVMRSMKKESAK